MPVSRLRNLRRLRRRPPQPAARPDPDAGDVRPATTTPSGDTGLWFVPTAEILPAKRWSASAYRVNFDHQQGFTDVSNWPVTFGYGIKDRVEVFGAWTLVRRIDRDVRPIFRPGNSQVGGLVNEYPFVSGGWSGNQLGDLWLGGKFNLMSEWQQKPMALAVRGMFKLPTASDEDEGVGTGKADFAFDLIASKEINQRVELSGFGGFIFRGDPDDVDISDGFRWGIGAGFPTRKSLRLTTELHGESQLDDVVYTGIARLIGEDGSIPPLVSDSDTATHFTVGPHLAGQGRVLRRRRGQLAFRDGRPRRRRVGVWQRVGRQLRLPGAHRVSTPVSASTRRRRRQRQHRRRHRHRSRITCSASRRRARRARLKSARQSTVSAVASSSIGCTVTYSWSAPTGTLTNRTAQNTPWTAPNTEGTVPVTVTVTCPQDGKTASDTVNINVVRPVVKQVVFEDVHFDFDRYSLRPEATRALDEAITAMQQNASLRHPD